MCANQISETVNTDRCVVRATPTATINSLTALRTRKKSKSTIVAVIRWTPATPEIGFGLQFGQVSSRMLLTPRSGDKWRLFPADEAVDFLIC